jgi:hypothetical protein
MSVLVIVAYSTRLARTVPALLESGLSSIIDRFDFLLTTTWPGSRKPRS